MQAAHQVLEDYEHERSLAEKAVGSSLRTSSKDFSSCLEEKLAFLVDVEDRVSSGKSHFSGWCSQKTVVKCL